MLQELPAELLKLVASFLPQPEHFLLSCKPASLLAHDPHALALWLLNTHGPGNAILYFTKCPCTKRWPLPRIHQVIQHSLEAGAQLPPAGLALAVLHWAAVTLGDSGVLQQLLSRLLEPHASHAPERAEPSCGGPPPSSAAAALPLPVWQACMGAKVLGGQLLTDTCAAGHCGAARVLLEAGAAPRDCCALNAAAENGHADVVSLLLASGTVDPRSNDDFALRMAAKGGHLAVLQLLLATGCSARAKQDEALVLAVGGGHVRAVRLLLEAGADAGARAGLLQLAASCPGSSEAPASPASGGGSAALKQPAVSLASLSLSDSVPAGSVVFAEPERGGGGADDGEALAVALVEALVLAGAQDDDGLALVGAAGAGRARVVQLLLRCCCSYKAGRAGQVDADGARGRPSSGGSSGSGAGAVNAGGGGAPYEPLAAALQCALQHGQIHIARLLLEAGAAVDMALLASRRYRLPDQHKAALLQLLDGFPAAVRCSQDLDEQLTAAAADDDDTFTCLLLRWGANPTGRECQALRKAVLHGRVASVRAIIGAAGVAGLRRQMPCCVMRAAVQRGHLEVVSELLSAGLWPNASSRHCCADPPTCVARMLCAANTLAMASLLMRFGAAAKAGEALHLVACGKAPSWRNEEVVQMVMDALLGMCVDTQQQQQRQRQPPGVSGGPAGTVQAACAPTKQGAGSPAAAAAPAGVRQEPSGGPSASAAACGSGAGKEGAGEGRVEPAVSLHLTARGAGAEVGAEAGSGCGRQLALRPVPPSKERLGGAIWPEEREEQGRRGTGRRGVGSIGGGAGAESPRHGIPKDMA